MATKKLIRKEISLIHWIFLTTGKILIGIGLGIILVSHYWYTQPYWYLLILVGAIILALTLYHLMKFEADEEIELRKSLKN